MYSHILTTACNHTHTVVQEYCKDDDESLQGMAKFDASHP